MPYLLAVADFTAMSDCAVQYACRLAQDHAYDVTLLHSFIVPIAFTDTPVPVIPMGDVQRIGQQRMDEMVTTLRAQYPSVSFTSDIRYGDAGDVISEHLETGNPLLTLIGAGAEDGWLDDNASQMMRSLDTPVLAVPEGTVYQAIRNICLACHYKDVDNNFPARSLIEMLRWTGAELHVLHIGTADQTDHKTFEQTALPQLLSGMPATYHYAQANGDVDSSIAAFAAAHDMSWLAVIPHHHSFWEGLFHRSHTKAIVRAGRLPVLALHELKVQ